MAQLELVEFDLEEELLSDPPNESQESIVELRLAGQPPIEQPEVLEPWLEVVWVAILIGTMAMLFVGLSLRHVWVYVLAYMAHHIMLAVGFMQLPAPSLPLRLYTQLTDRFPMFHNIMRVIVLFVASSLIVLAAIVPLLFYTGWSSVVPELLMYYFGVYLPIFTYCLILHGYQHR